MDIVNRIPNPASEKPNHSFNYMGCLATDEIIPNQSTTNFSSKIVRLPEVKNLTGYSRSAIYLKISQGTFPAPMSLGARAIGWLESEIVQWINERSNYRPLQK